MAEYDFGGGGGGGGGNINPLVLPTHYDIRKLGEHAEQYIIISERLEQAYLKRTLFWSMRLMQEFERFNVLYQVIPDYKYTAYGFFKREGGTFGFGVIIYGGLSFATKLD